MNEAREGYLKANGAEPTLAWLAQKLGARPEQVALAIRAGQPTLSLTAAGDEDKSGQWDIPVDSPEEDLADRIGLAEVLQTLPEEDRLLIRLRFYEEKTQSETAKVLHTTQVQISRRERRLLKELRRRLLQG